MRRQCKRWIAWGFSVASVSLIVLAGCQRDGDDANKKEAGKPNVQIEVKKDNLGKPIQGQTTALVKGFKLPTFRQAVILDSAPQGELQPPEMTYTGKNAVKIFETIANGMWEQVAFTDNEGKGIKYRAVIATELGDVQLDLFGEHAPNHVRSFVCLAKTGYYDGMGFYYSLNRKVEDATVAYIEAGCPRGTGEIGSGSIGYWLKPEISEKLTHQEGVLGACIGEDRDSAACRFYITAEANPYMDGRFTIFGRVTQGLDIVRTINKRPVTEFDRLQQPVVIRNVTIRTMVE